MATIDFMLYPLMFTCRRDIKVYDMCYRIVTKIDLIREESAVTRTWILFREVSTKGGLTPICTIQFVF